MADRQLVQSVPSHLQEMRRGGRRFEPSSVHIRYISRPFTARYSVFDTESMLEPGSGFLHFLFVLRLALDDGAFDAHAFIGNVFVSPGISEVLSLFLSQNRIPSRPRS